MRIRLTHQLAYPLEGADAGAGDAVGCEESGSPERAGPRYFVPGRLPCGACGLCRRGLAAACPAAVVVQPGGPSPAETAALELPNRFLTPLDDPAVSLPQPIPSELAAGAGLVALIIQAAAAANLTAGDVAVWLGGGPLAEVGAQLTAGRGARTLALSEPAPSPSFERCASVSDLLDRLERQPTLEGAAHQRSTRRVFLTRTEAATIEAAGRIADVGAVLVSIGRGPAHLTGLGLPSEARLTRVSGYHPDLVPEALALLRRGELNLPAARAWPRDRG